MIKNYRSLEFEQYIFIEDLGFTHANIPWTPPPQKKKKNKKKKKKKPRSYLKLIKKKELKKIY